MFETRRSTSRPARIATSLVAALAFAGGAAACGVQQGSDISAGGKQVDGVGSSATTSTVVLDEGSFEGTGGAVFLRNAAEATSQVTTMKMAMTMTTTGMPMLGDMVFTYDGAFDNETGRGHMTIDMGDVMEMLGEGSGQMEMVLDGDAVYVRSDLFSSLADGKPWVRMDQEGLGTTGSELGVGVQADPTSFLDFLEGVGDEVETVRREDLRGVPTTHVRTDIDMAKLLEDASEADRAEYEQSLEGLGGAADVFGSIPVDAWIDDNGYVRRYIMTFDMGAAFDESEEMGADLTMSIDIELFDFNEPVDVEVPDPSQVGDLESFSLGD